MSQPLTAHLTKEEMTDNLLGVSSLTVNAHLLDCPACADELERVKRTLSGFRDAAHSWSEHAQVAEEIGAVRNLTYKERSRPTMWLLATAAMILLIAGSVVYLHQEPTVSQTHPVAVATPMTNAGLSQVQLDQDNQLLSQVSVELSEAVPAPMQPLLVSEASGSSATTNK
jgi:predicted anti-sigma-YlaC factor YlaD